MTNARNKKVAIIIPVHNGLIYLKECVSSIMSNTHFQNYRIIFVESESTDGSKEYIKLLSVLYPNKITHLETKKEGLVAAINRGLHETKSDEDILLTQIDVIFPNLYDKCLIGFMNFIADTCPKPGIITTAGGGGISDESYMLGLHWVGTWCMYIMREVYEAIGDFDINYNPGCGDDIDYSYRAGISGFPIYNLIYTVNHHRAGEHLVDNEKLKEEHTKYFRKKFKLGEFKDE